MRVALLTTCHLEYVAQLANALAADIDVSIHILDGLNYVLRENWKSPDIGLFRDRYAAYLAARVKLGGVNPWPYKWDPKGLWGTWQVITAIRNESPAVLHVQEALDFRIFLVVMALRGVPLVVTVHDPRIRWGDRRKFYTWFELRLRAMLRRQARSLIVHSERLKAELLADKGVSRERVLVIPLGALSIYWHWANPEIAEEDCTVLFFGRLVPSKGLRDLVQAEPLVSAKCPRVKFVIAGEGDEWDACKHLVVHPERFVVQNEYVPNERVAELFQRASIVVLPYRDASQSGVAALACAFGKPVVATEVGGIPELVEHGVTGLLVHPGDVGALADAICTLLGNPELRKQMARNALDKAKEELSWNKVARTTLQAYRNAMSAP